MKKLILVALVAICIAGCTNTSKQEKNLSDSLVIAIKAHNDSIKIQDSISTLPVIDTTKFEIKK